MSAFRAKEMLFISKLEIARVAVHKPIYECASENALVRPLVSRLRSLDRVRPNSGKTRAPRTGLEISRGCSKTAAIFENRTTWDPRRSAHSVVRGYPSRLSANAPPWTRTAERRNASEQLPEPQERESVMSTHGRSIGNRRTSPSRVCLLRRRVFRNCSPRP